MPNPPPPPRAAPPPHATPSCQFLEALPALARVEDELAAALRPAMTQGRDQDRGFAEAAWMLAKALRFLLRAAQSDDPAAFDAALAEVDTDALAVAGRVRGLRAAAAPPGDPAPPGEPSRPAALNLGACPAGAGPVRMLLPDGPKRQTAD